MMLTLLVAMLFSVFLVVIVSIRQHVEIFVQVIHSVQNFFHRQNRRSSNRFNNSGSAYRRRNRKIFLNVKYRPSEPWDYIPIPTIYDQCEEIIKLIVEEIDLETAPKIQKRIARIMFVLRNNLVTEAEKVCMFNLLSASPEVFRIFPQLLTVAPNFFSAPSIPHIPKPVFQKAISYFKKMLSEKMNSVLNFLSKPFKGKFDLPYYKTPEMERRQKIKMEIDAFLTKEMHRSPLLFFIGIWIVKMVMKKLIQKNRCSYDRGDFFLLGKGGCFLGYTIIEKFNLSVDQMNEIFELCNLGDVDIAIYIKKDIENYDSLFNSINKIVKTSIDKIKNRHFYKNSDLHNLVRKAVPDSISTSEFSLHTRKNLTIKKIKGLRGYFFNRLVLNQAELYAGLAWISCNYSLTFWKNEYYCSFNLLRICLGFFSKGKWFKAELVDFSIPTIKDTYSSGMYNKIRDNCIWHRDFLSENFIRKIIFYFLNDIKKNDLRILLELSSRNL